MDQVSAPMLARLDSRDSGLWLISPHASVEPINELVSIARLPWSVVLNDLEDQEINAALDQPEQMDSELVRRRGLVQLVDTDPAEIILPPRSLPIFLMRGRQPNRKGGLGAKTRRLTMLAELRRREVSQLTILCVDGFAVPDELADLWDDGFRADIVFVSNDPQADEKLSQWVDSKGVGSLTLLRLSTAALFEQLRNRYSSARDKRLRIRVRSERGQLMEVDVSSVDDPEHPLIGNYEILSADDLAPVEHDQLAIDEIQNFFADPSRSWRPFAAGMAWQRDPAAFDALKARMRLLDRRGAHENKILFIKSESGAGATTFLRDLAWNIAVAGYPTLVAGKVPFTSTGLEVTNFLTRLTVATHTASDEPVGLYEVPCALVYDREHWEGREAELISFARELERGGRRVCIIIVTGPYVGLQVLAERRFTLLSELTHKVSATDAQQIGQHLNKFLKAHGSARSVHEWRSFYESSVTHSSLGITSFWIVLTFWLQRQFDFGETVQSWLYKQFIANIDNPILRTAILQIAAFSTVRTPLPSALLPESADWPTSIKLRDVQSKIGALGIVEIRGETEKFWVLIHDLLGRFLINAFFYDYETRRSAGYEAAQNPEHLRFLILCDISKSRALQINSLRDVAEAFAVSIFKIDPDHGHANFVPFWREALSALDAMPSTLRNTSRTFLHHAAISRRRIASDDDTFPMEGTEREILLQRAIEDVQRALNVAREKGAESDINLYNTLAHAFHDLAEVKSLAGNNDEEIRDLQKQARDATRKAYELNPDNSFVVETYARTLLSEAKTDPLKVAKHCLEVLNLVYTLMNSSASQSRRHALSRLADQAVDLLDGIDLADGYSDASEAGLIASALGSLNKDVDRFPGMELSDFPRDNRQRASELLKSPELRGNVQAARLLYLIAAIDEPDNFAAQLELLESLSQSGAIFTPQLQLEAAVLLYQQNRHHEADIAFKKLRQLWRRGEHFVEVPARLHWLLSSNGERRQVQGKISSLSDARFSANVRELQNNVVVFRPEEFALGHVRAGMIINGFISFGHNGPLLRPLTAARK